jgi:hypothetical protein
VTISLWHWSVAVGIDWTKFEFLSKTRYISFRSLNLNVTVELENGFFESFSNTRIRRSAQTVLQSVLVDDDTGRLRPCTDGVGQIEKLEIACFALEEKSRPVVGFEDEKFQITKNNASVET